LEKKNRKKKIEKKNRKKKFGKKIGFFFIIGSIVFFIEGDEELRSVNDSITNGVKQVLNSQRDKMFPFMRYFPMKSRQLLNDSFRAGKQFFVNIVNEHVATRETGNPRDLIDVWLDEVQKDGKSAADFPLERLPNVLLDLFAGGFETTTTTFQW
jgi:cytochrome P450